MGLSIFQQIKDIDQALFYQINGVWHHPVFDAVLPWTRHSNNWIPLYIGLLGWLFYQIGWKTLKWLLFALINVGLTDQISSSVFKPFFHRLRPCNDPALVGKTRLLLDQCAGGFSFTSSHAANHFGIAMFIFMTWGVIQKKYTRFFFVWAGVIAFAQIYVGVHYPLDIIGGTIIGLISGFTMSKAYLKFAGPISFKQA
ncbi:MAG: phosphatase PAP2 family protein [Chitinophagia bacterium]|nr:phosphatase PAP2 family protein [Chitinophagia bacterium]